MEHEWFKVNMLNLSTSLGRGPAKIGVKIHYVIKGNLVLLPLLIQLFSRFDAR